MSTLSSHRRLAVFLWVTMAWLAKCPAAHAEMLTGPGWVAYRDDLSGDASNYTAKSSGRAWYVDATSGDDGGPGTVARPWKTLARAASNTFDRDDALLLRCGAIWRETLTLPARAGDNLLVGGYGDCSKGQRPVIRGSVELPHLGWSKADGIAGAYVLDWLMPTPVQQIHVDGRLLVKARYPHQQGVGKEFALADGLGQKNKLRLRTAELKDLRNRDLVGATIHVRAVPWQVDSAKVSGFDADSGLITLDRALPWPILKSTGFILEGKRWMFGAPNEWFHDVAERRLLIMSTDGASPSSKLVEATVRDRGLVASGMVGLKVERVAFEHLAQIGVELTSVDRPILTDIRVLDAGEYGVHVQGSRKPTIKGSLINGAGWTGISIRNGDQAVVQGNRVVDTGLKNRAGGSRAAITVEGEGAVVSDNWVERAANLGINFFNRGSNKIQGNTVLMPCLRLTDCGGIYTWTSTDVRQMATSFRAMATVDRNMVIGGEGNLDGTPERGKNQTCGVYLDELSSGIDVANNVLIGSESGVCLHNASFNVVKENTMGAIRHASVNGSQTRDDADVLIGNRVTGNRLLARDNEVMPLKWTYPRGWRQFTKGRPVNDDGGNRVLTLTGQAAVYRPYAMASGASSIIPKGPFVPYFNPAGSGGKMTIVAPGGCVKPPCTSFVAGHGTDLMSTPSFELDNRPGHDRYVLSYWAKGGEGGGLSGATLRRAGPPYDALGVSEVPTALKPGEVHRSELVFQATGSGTARVDFSGQLHGETIISDVSLKTVQAYRVVDVTHLAVQLLNLGGMPKTFSCAEAGVSSCAATDESGQPIKWPLSVPARSTVLVMALDPQWRK